MKTDYKIQIIKEFADQLTEWGFTVYLAESMEYGFYTDDKDSRIVYFQTNFGMLKFSGCYFSEGNGSSWAMGDVDEPTTKRKAEHLLYSNSPFPFTRYETAKAHIKRYTASNYTVYKGE